MLLEEAPPIASPIRPPLIDVISTPDSRLDMAVMHAKVSTGDWIVHQKGGHALEPHAHLDSGSFTLRIGEDTWLTDLGRFNYPSGTSYQSSYWFMPKEPRYEGGLSYFRKNDLSHNLVTLAGRPLNPLGRARISSHREGLISSEGARFGQVVWDTTYLYRPIFTASKRSFTLTERGRFTTLDVTDEFTLPSNTQLHPSNILATWRALTCGNESVAPEKGNSHTNSIVLTRTSASFLNRVTAESSAELVKVALGARIVEPSSAAFSILPADPNTQQSLKVGFPDGIQPTNSGCTSLTIPLNGSHVQNLGDNTQGIRITVRFQYIQ
jgi:hypothetical protein